MAPAPISVVELSKRKTQGDKIVMVTAYDATFAQALDAAGVDMLLVGDSLGMVIQGHSNTLKVSLDHVVYHTTAVCRGAKRAHVVADLPFLSYHLSCEQAVASAGRLIQEGGAQSVKLEGGEAFAPTVERIVMAGIPVMGHIGLTPQRIHELGGFKVQGLEPAGARRLVHAGLALQEAGAYSLVLEGIPSDLAAEITSRLSIPTVGIGAGPACDGQVLVCYDLLGLNRAFLPKFVKRYETVGDRVQQAAAQFAQEVRAGTFPDEAHSYRGKALRLVGNNDEGVDSNDPERVIGVPV